MKTMVLCLAALLFPIGISASRSDSVKVECLLREAAGLPADSNHVLFFAYNLLDVPYKANPLDETNEETLVVHLDQMDCMTFVETVLALRRADKQGLRDFGSFKQALQYIRYRGGYMDGYASRLHYVSDWIADNTEKGVVRERTSKSESAVIQPMSLNFMSTHADKYRQLKENPALVRQIAEVEAEWQNILVAFIPKDQLDAPPEKLDIRNGDLLVLTTNIEGLDAVHVGFAVWIGEKLHLLHASSVWKKVLLDPQPLFDYLKDKKNHTGVRVLSVF